jgi:hypothetical protein
MAKAARRYDIFLPLTDNAGNPFPDALFDEVEGRLIDRFGGLTTQQREFPFRGTWQEAAHIYHDDVIVMTALDFRQQGSTRFIASLKRELLKEFQQLEILITEQSLRVR